jgi:hypothetical protein
MKDITFRSSYCLKNEFSEIRFCVKMRNYGSKTDLAFFRARADPHFKLETHGVGDRGPAAIRWQIRVCGRNYVRCCGPMTRMPSSESHRPPSLLHFSARLLLRLELASEVPCVGP